VSIAFIVFARFAIAATFALSAASKVPVVRGFAESLGGYGVPKALWKPVALAVIGIEFALSAVLVFGGGTALVVALSVTVALLLVFSVALSRRLATASAAKAPCFCFGSVARTVSFVDLARNGGLIVLAAGAISAIVSLPSGMHSSTTISAPADAVELALVVVSAVTFAMIWSRVPDIVQLITDK
jgi:hypothetical protein